MERGKNYKVNYQVPGEKEREITVTFLSEDDDKYVFSGRPTFGTTPISKSYVKSIEETSDAPKLPRTVRGPRIVK